MAAPILHFTQSQFFYNHFSRMSSSRRQPASHNLQLLGELTCDRWGVIHLLGSPSDKCMPAAHCQQRDSESQVTLIAVCLRYDYSINRRNRMARSTLWFSPGSNATGIDRSTM